MDQVATIDMATGCHITLPSKEALESLAALTCRVKHEIYFVDGDKAYGCTKAWLLMQLEQKGWLTR